MRDPFLIDGPACISFSGGRTSGYMLWRILQAHGGTLPEDVFVCFQNTGKELPETLDFIQECADRWSVPITWIELAGFNTDGDGVSDNLIYRTVDRATCSVNGEPFEFLLTRLKALPNPAARTCTSYMKTRLLAQWMRDKGYGRDWVKVLGLRADEPRRVANLSAPNRETRWGEGYAPLARDGVTVRDVAEFWRQQPFDLRLPNLNGKTMHGNCDLCFLKPANQILALIREQPKRAIWWAKQERTGERATGGLFRIDRPSYKQMLAFADEQGEMFKFDDEALQDCACTD